MAGIKISKLKPYEEAFNGEYLEDLIDDMIIPVSVGNTTISIKVKDLVNLISADDEIQNERLNEQKQLILQNTDLINQMSEIILNRINEIQKDQNESDKVTALSLIDLQNHLDDITLAIHNKINQIKNEQSLVDEKQDEKINSISDFDWNNLNIWEIYNE